MADPAVYLVTGPSAAGKTTVGRLLAGRFDRAACVEADVFRRCIVSGRAEMTPELSAEALRQLELRYRIATAAGEAYFDEGFTVVVEDVIAGPLLDSVVARIRPRPLHVIVLLPSKEQLARRDEARAERGYSHFSVDELYAGFVDETGRIGRWLDTSDLTPDATVDEILARPDLSLVEAR